MTKPKAKNKAPAEKTDNTSETTDQVDPKDSPQVATRSGLPEGFRAFEGQDFLDALADIREEIENIRLLAGQVKKRDHKFTVDELRQGLIVVAPEA